MKSILLAVFVLGLLHGSIAASQEIAIQFSNGPGLLFATPTELQFTRGALVSESEDNGYPFVAGDAGFVTFTTPVLRPNIVESGGTFGPGGSFFVSSSYGASINGTFIRGQWSRKVLIDGTNEYVLAAEVKGDLLMNGTSYFCHGVTVQLSADTGMSPYMGSWSSSGGVTNVTAVPAD